MIYRFIEESLLALTKILIAITISVVVFSTVVYKINEQTPILIIDDEEIHQSTMSPLDELDSLIGTD